MMVIWRERKQDFSQKIVNFLVYCVKKRKKNNQEDLKSLNGSTEFDYLKYIAWPETDSVCTTQYIIIIIS